jgi:hypothetical protein
VESVIAAAPGAAVGRRPVGCCGVNAQVDRQQTFAREPVQRFTRPAGGIGTGGCALQSRTQVHPPLATEVAPADVTIW